MEFRKLPLNPGPTQILVLQMIVHISVTLVLVEDLNKVKHIERWKVNLQILDTLDSMSLALWRGLDI